MYSTGFAYLLWFLSGFGITGFHRLYLGKPGTWLLWLCTGGLFGVGAVYDFFTLGRQVRESNYRAAIFGKRPVYWERSWRTVDDGETRVVREKKESPERVILRLAKHSGGIISPGELALEADISIEQAREQLDALVTRGFAELRPRKTGTLVYVIPEFMDRDSPLENL